MQNHKIETNSELIYEDGSFWSTFIFIKIIGSDWLWFPLPPSEVLYTNNQNYPYLIRKTFETVWLYFAGSLRAEKVELTAQVKKHQAHIQYQEQVLEKLAKEVSRVAPLVIPFYQPGLQ